MKDIKKVHDFVKNKTAIIVGPSASLKGSNMGEFIDSFNVVVRLNNYFKIDEKDEKDIGKRTDILYHCFGLGDNKDKADPNEWKEIKYIIFCNKPENQKLKLKKFLEKFNYYNFYIQEESFLNKIQMKTNLHLHTGVTSIFHLLSLPFKEVHALGFSFYRDTYIGIKEEWSKEKSIKHSKNVGHDIEKELKFFLNEIKNYNNFYPHGILEDIIKGKIK